MFRNRFDILLGVLLLACIAAIGSLLLEGGSQAAQQNLAVNKAMEREMAVQAKISFLERLYAPVSVLRDAGEYESALLKLDELSRRYPDEAYGELLRGEILLQLRALPQAVEHLALAVRMNGDYVDRQNPLSRRGLIGQLLAEQLPRFKAEAKQGASRRQQAVLKNLYYLQGRMAGGCE